jgi:hypothetical protein
MEPALSVGMMTLTRGRDSEPDEMRACLAEGAGEFNRKSKVGRAVP